MNEDVVFKGSRAGLRIVFDDSLEFSSMVEKLKMKLESAIHFFGKGTIVNIDADKVTHDQEVELSELLSYYGMKLQITAKSEASENLPYQAVKEETVVINNTVRGGQEVFSEGSVIICGNVNPGAKIIAGGNIEIKGVCRGIVHAGAFGDTKAIVIAQQMLAMQIRIADLIARAPDKLETADCTEYACIKDGNIVIAPVNKQEVC